MKKPVGRPRIAQEPLKNINLRLDPATVAKAREIGSGNASAGVRKAVKEWEGKNGSTDGV